MDVILREKAIVAGADLRCQLIEFFSSFAWSEVALPMPNPYRPDALQ